MKPTDPITHEAPLRWSVWLPCGAALALALTAGCMPKPCQTPPPFYLSLQASERLNTDDRSRATPVIVHVLQLKDITGMDLAGYQDVWDRADDKKPAPFSKDLLHEQELVVAPGSRVTRWIPRDPSAHYVVAAGKVRKALGRTWYAVYQLHPVREGQCVEQPVDANRTPTSDDEILYFQLEDYHIRYNRPDLIGASSRATGPSDGRDG